MKNRTNALIDNGRVCSLFGQSMINWNKAC